MLIKNKYPRRRRWERASVRDPFAVVILIRSIDQITNMIISMFFVLFCYIKHRALSRSN